MSPRFYLPQPLIPNSVLTLPEPISKHLHVLRVEGTDQLSLFDGQGHAISAQVESINKKSVTVTLLNDLTEQAPSSLTLHLGQSICRADRMDLIIQKAVELNVSEITPIYAERSQGRLKGSQLERKLQHWQEIIINAAEQCHQNYLPKLNPPLSLPEWLNEVTADLKLQCALTHTQSLKTIKASPKTCALLIGPEGGLTDTEVTAADQQNFVRISLGARILRVETAAILALGLVDYQFNNF